MRSARIAISWGKWANMAKSARFANKKGQIVKQRCKKDAKAKENRRNPKNSAKLGEIGQIWDNRGCHVMLTDNIAKLGLVPSTEVVQREFTTQISDIVHVRYIIHVRISRRDHWEIAGEV